MADLSYLNLLFSDATRNADIGEAFNQGLGIASNYMDVRTKGDKYRDEQAIREALKKTTQGGNVATSPQIPSAITPSTELPPAPPVAAPLVAAPPVGAPPVAAAPMASAPIPQAAAMAAPMVPAPAPVQVQQPMAQPVPQTVENQPVPQSGVEQPKPQSAVDRLRVTQDQMKNQRVAATAGVGSNAVQSAPAPSQPGQPQGEPTPILRLGNMIVPIRNLRSEADREAKRAFLRQTNQSHLLPKLEQQMLEEDQAALKTAFETQKLAIDQSRIQAEYVVSVMAPVQAVKEEDYVELDMYGRPVMNPDGTPKINMEDFKKAKAARYKLAHEMATRMFGPEGMQGIPAEYNGVETDSIINAYADQARTQIQRDSMNVKLVDAQIEKMKTQGALKKAVVENKESKDELIRFQQARTQLESVIADPNVSPEVKQDAQRRVREINTLIDATAAGKTRPLSSTQVIVDNKPAPRDVTKAAAMIRGAERAEAGLAVKDLPLTDKVLSSLARSATADGNKPLSAAMLTAGLSDEGRRYLTNAAVWVNNVLRDESGAAISIGEFNSYYSTYFPAPGDTPATIKLKAELRQAAVQDRKESIGMTQGDVGRYAGSQSQPANLKTSPTTPGVKLQPKDSSPGKYSGRSISKDEFDKQPKWAQADWLKNGGKVK